MFLSTNNHKYVGRLCGWFTVAIGVLVLFGWVVDIPQLKSIGVGLATMKVNTALGFISAGSAIILLNRPNLSRSQRRMIQLLTLLTFLNGFLALVEYIFGWNLYIDELLFRDIETAVDAFPGRMSAATAICFVLVSLAILLSSRQRYLEAHFINIVVTFMAILAMIGYLYDVTSLYSIAIYSSLALHTAFCFLLLSVGILFASSDKGGMAVVTSKTAGGVMARRLLPAAIVLPILLGYLVLLAEGQGAYGHVFAITLLASLMIISLFVFIYANSQSLYRLDMQRFQAEVLLQQTEEKYRHIFANAAEGIFQALPNGRIITANHSLAAMLGFSSPESLMNAGSHLGPQLFVNPDKYEEYNATLTQAAVIQTFEAQLLRQDRSKIWVSINARRVYTENAISFYDEGSITNITVRKQLQEQLRQAQKMEAIGRLAGGIAHDFNNILTVIIGYSDLALRQLDDEHKAYPRIREVYKAGNRAADLTKQLLAFSRKQIVQTQILDLNAVISQLNGMLGRLIGAHIDLITKLADSLPSIKADKGQLEQIIMNLVVNARDAMPDGGRILIETQNVFVDEAYSSYKIDMPPGPYVMMAVTDTGRGIDEETQAHIFEPFFTTKETKGTGLGLFTVYGIVKQYGGDITVYSELNNGTIFKIYLPPAVEPADIEQPQTATPPAVSGSETVLVIEDSEPIRQLIIQILTEQGYNVYGVEDGQEALTFCEEYQQEIHLIISDVIMPGMNIRDLSQCLIEYYPNIKFLYMSGYTNTTLAYDHILNSGMPFLPKPFNITELTHAVYNALHNQVSKTP